MERRSGPDVGAAAPIRGPKSFVDPGAPGVHEPIEAADLLVAAVLYLAAVWLDGIGNGLPVKVLPRPVAYFMQIATLFPRAATMAIDYRVEAWSCSEKKWQELDIRPYFPIDADDKENRFQRVMHFYRDHRKTMQTLERYVVGDENHGRVLPGQGHVHGP